MELPVLSYQMMCNIVYLLVGRNNQVLVFLGWKGG